MNIKQKVSPSVWNGCMVVWRIKIKNKTGSSIENIVITSQLDHNIKQLHTKTGFVTPSFEPVLIDEKTITFPIISLKEKESKLLLISYILSEVNQGESINSTISYNIENVQYSNVISTYSYIGDSPKKTIENKTPLCVLSNKKCRRALIM